MSKKTFVSSVTNRRFFGFLVAGALFCCSYAYAELGVDWVKYEGNPVLTVGASGSWEADHVHNAVVIKEGSIYKMWYNGYDGQRSRTGYATSPDGINWTKYSGNPVLSATIGTIIFEDGVYKAWAGLLEGGDIGYWTSSDGINWTQYAGNPVLRHGTGWESVAISDPMVIKDGSTYKMWYQGGEPGSQHRIGYATSPDGINWTKYAGNPIFIPEALGTWAINPFILKEGSLYKIWYGDAGGSPGGSIRIFYATSTDGINWVKYPTNPVITNAGGFDWQHALGPWIINDNGDYKMWYTGQNNGQMKIGYAISYYVPDVSPGFTCDEDELRVMAGDQPCDVLDKLDELRGCISDTQSALKLSADTCPVDALVTILVPPGILNPATQAALKNNPNAATIMGVVTSQPRPVPAGK